MSWLERLKNLESSGVHPREPREPGFLGLQGCLLGGVQKLDDTQAPAANDTDKAMTVASLNPDRHCWPHSAAMSTMEIDRFLSRVALFTNKGLKAGEAETMADELMFRDRDGDDRGLCLECSNLEGVARWKCGASERAEAGRNLPRELVLMLQRCTELKLNYFPFDSKQPRVEYSIL